MADSFVLPGTSRRRFREAQSHVRSHAFSPHRLTALMDLSALTSGAMTWAATHHPE